MERSAFSRARDYLAYQPVAKWGAIFCAAISSVLYVVLLLLLGLFADLLVSGGEIPKYSDLSSQQREQFERDWNALAEEERRSSLQALPIPFNTAELDNLSAAVPEQQSESAAPVRWNAFVGHMLERRVSEDAAQSYRIRAVAHRDAPPGADPNHVRLGLLSLVVRNQSRPFGNIIGRVARVAPWTFHPTRGGLANLPYLIGLLVIAAAVALLRFAFTSIMHRWAAEATIEAITRLRRMIYHHTSRLGSLTISEEGTAEAVGLFTNDVEAVHDGLYASLTSAVRDPVKFVLLVLIALLVNFWLGLAFICGALLVWIISRQATVFYRRRGKHVTRRAANQLSLLKESIKVMRLVKGYLMEPLNQARVERQLSDYSVAQLKRFTGESIHRPLTILLGTIAVAALLFLAGWMVLEGSLSVGGLVTMAVALTSLWFPLDHWLAQRRHLHRAEDSAALLFEFLDRRGDVGQVVGAEFLKSVTKELVFDGVSLREPGSGRILLNKLDLTIPAGKRVAIVGGDEIVMHALVALIPRFLDPSEGEVRLDGKNIRWVTLDSLRNQVSLVMQQNYIFNDTVANNIGCGDPSYSIPQIIEAAKVVHAHNFVQKLPYGYETQIGEHGFGLRVGEKFRIALARAVLRDPAILVIEEPDADLEQGANDMLDDAYARILGERTVVFLPRRLSTIKSCDMVYFIHDGKLETAGEHRNLLQENELYRHLHYLEYNMFSGRV